MIGDLLLQGVSLNSVFMFKIEFSNFCSDVQIPNCTIANNLPLFDEAIQCVLSSFKLACMNLIEQCDSICSDWYKK